MNVNREHPGQVQEPLRPQPPPHVLDSMAHEWELPGQSAPYPAPGMEPSYIPAHVPPVNGSAPQTEVLRPVSPPAPQAVDAGVDQFRYRSRARRWPTSALPAGGPKALPPAGVDARDLTDPSRRPQQDWMPRRNLFYAAPPHHALAPDAVIADPRATIRTDVPTALEAGPDASWVEAAAPAVPAVSEAQAYAPPVPPHNGIAPPQVHAPPPETQWVPLPSPPIDPAPLPATPPATVPPANTSAPPPVPPSATPDLAPPAPPVAPLPPRPPAPDLHVPMHVPMDAQWTLRPDENALPPLDTAWAQPAPQPAPAPPDATWTLPAQAPGPAAWSSSTPLDTPLTPAGPVPLDAPVAGPRSFPKSPPRGGAASRRSLLVRVALVTAGIVAVLAVGWWLLAGRGGSSPATPQSAAVTLVVAPAEDELEAALTSGASSAAAAPSPAVGADGAPVEA